MGEYLVNILCSFYLLKVIKEEDTDKIIAHMQLVEIIDGMKLDGLNALKRRTVIRKPGWIASQTAKGSRLTQQKGLL